jgi:hypothetical protein
MTTIRSRWIGLVTIWAAALLGCAGPEYTRLNAPPQGDAPAHPEWVNYYIYHNDQGMLADMSIADIHFVPHSACLSGVGEARLERYAELLAIDGGTINYDPAITDQTLVDARLRCAREFLAQAAETDRRIDVQVGCAGGRGMYNKEATAAEGIAQQPEPRKTAYKLNNNTALDQSNSGK